MKMQDKEFDEIFRSKLTDLEVTPSERVWGGIADELNQGKGKRSLVFILSIAASILVLVAAGVWVIANRDDAGTKLPVYTGTKTNQPKASDVIAKAAPIATGVTTQVEQKAVVKQQLATSLAGATTKKPVQMIAPEKLEVTPKKDETAQPVQKEELTAIAATKLPQDITPVVPDVPLNVEQLSDDQAPFKTQPLVNANQPQLAVPSSAKPAKARHGIRSLGDLINVVVAKVDKRKDKVIEFTDNEDGDGDNVTGLNLGIIKIKKEK